MQQHPFPNQCLSNNRRLKSCESCRLSKRACIPSGKGVPETGDPSSKAFGVQSLASRGVCKRCADMGIACVYSRNSTKSKAYMELKKKQRSHKTNHAVRAPPPTSGAFPASANASIAHTKFSEWTPTFSAVADFPNSANPPSPPKSQYALSPPPTTVTVTLASSDYLQRPYFTNSYPSRANGGRMSICNLID